MKSRFIFLAIFGDGIEALGLGVAQIHVIRDSVKNIRIDFLTHLRIPNVFLTTAGTLVRMV